MFALPDTTQKKEGRFTFGRQVTKEQDVSFETCPTTQPNDGHVEGQRARMVEAESHPGDLFERSIGVLSEASKLYFEGSDQHAKPSHYRPTPSPTLPSGVPSDSDVEVDEPSSSANVKYIPSGDK
ncbi:unnamed protein product [Lepeophtheirus salmonis]|uniref:(salmon louse) hypothetical protein n=1 Tax=Lepeophtheirus salmonis TaxID=72036 RepID=A0A7R8H9J7_LEPSM|nr:unnamed protein product [Lepeophtheirus salmonis]CAF2959661.1 unnamed protein product [Lepeophtheirus salmonis]